jgi:hypothetical protein
MGGIGKSSSEFYRMQFHPPACKIGHIIDEEQVSSVQSSQVHVITINQH